MHHPCLALLPLVLLSFPSNRPLPSTGSRDATTAVRGIQEGGSARPEEGVLRAGRYLLHLDGGQVLRVEARCEDGANWEVRREREWVPLTGVRVARAVDEKELLASARRLRREAWKEEDPVRHVAYVQWLVGEGLRIEALETLDDILHDEPDLAPAVELARDLGVTFRLPDPATDLGAWFREAAKLGPAGREWALARLEEARTSAGDELPGLRDELASELSASSWRQRALATHTLRRLLPGHEVRGLLARSVLDSSEEVRRGAALALRATDDPAMVVPVVRALSSRSEQVRSNAIDALVTMRYPAAVAPLYAHLIRLQSGGGGRAPHANVFIGRQFAYVQDFDVEVAQGAAIADPSINVATEGALLDAASLGVTEYVAARESSRTRSALASLTGADPGRTTASWKRWWQENGDAWATVQSGPPVSPRTPGR